MAVVHLITPEYPPAFGGVSDYTRTIARGMSAAGDDVHVWCPAGEAGGDPITVHPEFARFDQTSLARAGKQLDAFPAPRRIIVQWVPHGYGRRAMNLAFCRWLLSRARAGDSIELMVHEPFVAFFESGIGQAATAAVHRMMTIVLLQAASRVWLSIPAWEPMWRPYALGRSIPFEWLPIPSSLSVPPPSAVADVRTRVSSGRPIVGHVGTYGSLIAPVLAQIAVKLLEMPDAPTLLLIGNNSDTFRAGILDRHPNLERTLLATGTLEQGAMAAHIAACDVLVQPYPDGVSARRTTAMAGLFLGVPVVTNRGRLTEPMWNESGAVALVGAFQASAFVTAIAALLSDARRRQELAAKGGALYRAHFDAARTIAALRSAA